MNVEQFFQSALPVDGLYCAVGIKNGVTKHVFSTGIVGLLEAAEEFDATGHDAYFACHTFSEQRRLQNYALKSRSFYLDIDCGEAKAAEGKGYATKSEALLALKQFCKQFSLPRPYIVDSGRGLHVYWLMDEAVHSAEWIPVAKAFKAAALKFGLIIDAAVPSDSARILRVPGTRNYKDRENPLPVAVLANGVHITFDMMREAVKDYIYKPKLTLAPRPMDATSKALMGNYESNFALLARKSLKGTGCAQIAHAIQNAASLEEPLWHAALSIAVRCNDGPVAIHKISKAYPDYDPEETQKKAENTGGPRTCAWYKLESGNGAVCKGCERKVSSPIQLGRVVIEGAPQAAALPKAGIESLFGQSGASRAEDTQGGEEEDDESSSGSEATGILSVLPVKVDIPEIPFPYFRGKHGGIYMQTKDSEGERTDVLIFEDDLFVTKRVVDPHDGVCAVLQLHSPHDPVSEFAVPLKYLQSKDKFRDIMSEKGIVASEGGMKQLMSYTTAYVKSLRKMTKAEEARVQFGWADGNTKFILGNKEITAKEINYAPPSNVTKDLAPHMSERGSFEQWRKAFNMYVPVQEQSQAQVFALMSAFGSTLMKFSGIPGALISLVNTESGTGKTSILRLINSVFGHPDELMQLQKDTTLVKQHRMGVMNSLCNCFDEITNAEPKELSELVYGISQGRGRNRMRADANQERTNNTRWSCLTVSSGNASVLDKLSANKATSDGEMMRVMEYKVKLAFVEGASDMLNDLHHNYGHAGVIFMKAIVKNCKDVPEMIAKMRRKLTKAMRSAVKERFWVTTAACNLVAGIIAKNLGLHDYDMESLMRWVVEDSIKQRNLVQDHIVSPADMLGEYLLENFGYTLIVGNKINPTTMTNVWKQPSGKICARFEMGANLVHIPKKDFKDYCVKRQGDLETVLYTASEDYVYLKTTKKRLAGGTGMVSPPVDSYEFRISNELAQSIFAEKPEDES